MSDAFLPPLILLGDEVLLYFIMCVEIVQNSNLVLKFNSGLLYKNTSK
jgi:hypothetical protein